MHDSQDALKQFGTRIGLPHLKLNDDRLCELTVGDGLEIFFEGTDKDRELRLNGRVGALPGADAEVLRALLVANYNGQATGASALALDPMSGELILGRTIDVGPLDPAAFADEVETFLKYLSFWTGHLATLGRSSPTPAMAAPTEFMIRA